MYIAAKFHKANFLWRVFETDYECSGSLTLLDLRLRWFKHTREWKVQLEKGYGNATVRFYREINGKREGWGVQGPIFKLY